MGTNGAAMTRFNELGDAVQKLHEANANLAGASAIYAPRTAGFFDDLAATDNQPLASPPSVAGRRRLVTNQVGVAETQGTSSDATTIFVGDFSQVLVGMRSELKIEVSAHAADSSNSAFRALQVWIRASLRADVVLAQPTHLVRIIGIVP